MSAPKQAQDDPKTTKKATPNHYTIRETNQDDPKTVLDPPGLLCLPLGSLWGRSWVTLGPLLGALGPLLGALGCSWALLGGLLGALGPPLGSLRSIFGGCWGVFGGDLRPETCGESQNTNPHGTHRFWWCFSEPPRAHWVLLDRSWRLLDPSWVLLGRSWWLLGRSLGLLGHSWGLWSGSRCDLGGSGQMD